MKNYLFFLCFFIISSEVSAQGACELFGPNDITCQSDMLSREIEPQIRELERQQKRNFDILVSQCQYGNQSACDRLNAWINTPVPKEPYASDWARSFSLGGN